LAKRNVCKKIKRIFHKKEKLYVQLIVFLMNLEYEYIIIILKIKQRRKESGGTKHE
jgi:hypothetical protein